MTLHLPETLKIAGHEYRVVFPYHFMERGDLDGQHDGGMKEIRVDDRDGFCHEPRPESAVLVTFLHEILHACDDISGHKIFRDNERAIEGISEVLFQVLRDNRLKFWSED